MEINVRDHENVKIVDLTGELETNSAPNLEKILIEFTKEEGMQILINMENLDFASSYGVQSPSKSHRDQSLRLRRTPHRFRRGERGNRGRL